MSLRQLRTPNMKSFIKSPCAALDVLTWIKQNIIVLHFGIISAFQFTNFKVVQMNRTITNLTLGCAILCFNSAAYAATEQDAAAAARRGDFAAAAVSYEQLVAMNPTSVALRLELADALAKNRQWNRAVSEYEAILNLQPENTEAVLGIGTVHRWQGNTGKAKRAYEKARALAPQNPDGSLGLAATYVLDHDYVSADELYAKAEQTWPKDRGVQQAVNGFRSLRKPRLYLFWENDLSFETRQIGAIAPFGSREEIGAELQEENRFTVGPVNTKIYSRNDKKLFYTHYFGLNHMLDFSARASQYQYNVPNTALEYASIDTYQEYRGRYTMQLKPEHVFAVRYTLRPTKLKLSQSSFTAHKIEAEFNSQWYPRFSTMLGGGWLRDLDSNATSVSQLTDRSLVKLGFQWDKTNRLSLGAKYITNPDLDNSLNSTIIGEGSYSLTDTWSALGRYRTDDYKAGSDQTSFYVGARFVPDNHWWSEFGLKHAERGTARGNYGLASIIYRW